MTEPAKKTVLITGAGGGFGQHMVRQFRGAGSRLILTDLTDAALDSIEAEASGGLVASVVADLATEAGCKTIADACATLDIVPDILVNNAGIGIAGRIDHVPKDQWETLMQLNLLAPMRLTNHFLPAMVERGSGHIVNISSLAGWVGSPGLSSYCASKFGLRGFGVALSRDLEGTGVHITNVYPCFSQTPILDSPQYGYEGRLVVPPRMISDPADVVANMIAGVRNNKLHVFPDGYSRITYWLLRIAPWLVTMLDRRMYAKAIEAGKKAN